jgi:hypothetical protein
MGGGLEELGGGREEQGVAWLFSFEALFHSMRPVALRVVRSLCQENNTPSISFFKGKTAFYFFILPILYVITTRYGCCAPHHPKSKRGYLVDRGKCKINDSREGCYGIILFLLNRVQTIATGVLLGFF